MVCVGVPVLTAACVCACAGRWWLWHGSRVAADAGGFWLCLVGAGLRLGGQWGPWGTSQGCNAQHCPLKSRSAVRLWEKKAYLPIGGDIVCNAGGSASVPLIHLVHHHGGLQLPLSILHARTSLRHGTRCVT